MFGKKNELDDRYFEGRGTGEANAYTLINEIIERHKDDDPKAVLTAIEIICEHQLRCNPYARKVTLTEPKYMQL